jgi:hypothetical protein
MVSYTLDTLTGLNEAQLAQLRTRAPLPATEASEGPILG